VFAISHPCQYSWSLHSPKKCLCLQAAQALEPSVLIALQLLASGGKVVLVGDPKQLPATVISRLADSKNLAQSLFERLQKVGCLQRFQNLLIIVVSKGFVPNDVLERMDSGCLL
jgi:AAA domain